MRPLLAWLLLFLISTQWVGGRNGFKVIYTMEIERQMSHEEKYLAALIKEETGFDSHVEIIPEEEVAQNSPGYSQHFVIAKEIEGQTIFYSLRIQPVEFVEFEYLTDTPFPQEENSKRMALLDRLFSDFTFQKPGFSIRFKAPEMPAQNYILSGFASFLPAPAPAPPPEFLS